MCLQTGHFEFAKVTGRSAVFCKDICKGFPRAHHRTDRACCGASLTEVDPLPQIAVSRPMTASNHYPSTVKHLNPTGYLVPSRTHVCTLAGLRRLGRRSRSDLKTLPRSRLERPRMAPRVVPSSTAILAAESPAASWRFSSSSRSGVQKLFFHRGEIKPSFRERPWIALGVEWRRTAISRDVRPAALCRFSSSSRSGVQRGQYRITGGNLIRIRLPISPYRVNRLARRCPQAFLTTAHGRLMLTVSGGLAEFERDLIRARTGAAAPVPRQTASRWGGSRSLPITRSARRSNGATVARSRLPILAAATMSVAGR